MVEVIRKSTGKVTTRETFDTYEEVLTFIRNINKTTHKVAVYS